MATYDLTTVRIMVGGEPIRAGDLIAMDARGQAVGASRALSEQEINDSLARAIIGVAVDVTSPSIGDAWWTASKEMRSVSYTIRVPAITNRDDLAAALGEGSEMLAAFDRFTRDAVARASRRAQPSRIGAGLREVFRCRILADLERERERLPVTAAEIRARLYSRPRPRLALADGRVAPQAYDLDDPLPLP